MHFGKWPSVVGLLQLSPVRGVQILGAEFFRKASAVGSQGRGVRWLRSRCVVGTFFFLRFAFGTFCFCGCAAKGTQRFDRNAGGPRLWQVGWIRGLSLDLVSANLGRNYFGCGNFRETGARRCVSLATRVAKNCGTLASFAVCRSNLFLYKVCYRNLLLPRLRRENFGTKKIWRSIGATQRFDCNAGGPKLWQVGRVRGLSLELAFANLGRESFGCGNFHETGALRSVSLATRVAKNCGKVASFAACCWNLLLPRFAFGTFFFQGCVAKILGTKNLAKHRRYAALRSQRGTPKIVASWLH